MCCRDPIRGVGVTVLGDQALAHRGGRRGVAAGAEVVGADAWEGRERGVGLPATRENFALEAAPEPGDAEKTGPEPVPDDADPLAPPYRSRAPWPHLL